MVGKGDHFIWFLSDRNYPQVWGTRPIVYLGAVCEKEQWRPIIHRRKRCDLSLFQLGLRLLEHLLNEEMPIPVQFHVTI
jgi:hypothetical protein